MKKILICAIALIAAGCASSQVSVSQNTAVRITPVSSIAIAPGSGVFGDAIAVELFNLGLNVVDANEAATLIGRVGLTEFEMTSTEGRTALRDAGIEAVLSARAVDAADGTPESASVRVTATDSGAIIAGVTWQNGWGGQRGSIADRTMRKNLSEAAREISAALFEQIQPAR